MTSYAENIQRGLVEGPFLFIVNPRSGTGAVEVFRQEIKKLRQVRNFEVIESRSGEHSKELARTAKDRGFAAVVAVGGDGSVHEIGTQLIGSPVPLGIIPTGSGNGIARHLGISMRVKAATQQVLAGKTRAMDTFTLNGKAAIGFCGVGFDGHIARLFDGQRARGFSNYVKLVLRAFSSYSATSFQLETGGEEQRETKAYSITCANISQFGNNAYINPGACDDDGLLEVILVRPFPVLAFPLLASRLFLKSFDHSEYVSVTPLKRVTILNKGKAEVQIDGEPFGTPEELNFEAVPRSLNVIIP